MKLKKRERKKIERLLIENRKYCYYWRDKEKEFEEAGDEKNKEIANRMNYQNGA